MNEIKRSANWLAKLVQIKHIELENGFIRFYKLPIETQGYGANIMPFVIFYEVKVFELCSNTFMNNPSLMKRYFSESSIDFQKDIMKLIQGTIGLEALYAAQNDIEYEQSALYLNHTKQARKNLGLEKIHPLEIAS